MYAKQISDYMYLIDVKPAGIEKFISSYVVKAEKIAIIETGPTVAAKNLLLGLEEIGVSRDDVDYVTVSHIHADHGGGAGTLLKSLPNAKLVVHPRGVQHMVDPEKLWDQTKQVLGYVARIYGKIESVPKERIIPAPDGMIIDLGTRVQLEVLEALGHASHHLCYYEKHVRGLFSGDVAGIYLPQYDVILPTTPTPFHLQTTLASIERLVKVKPDRLYYTHFGDADNAVKRLEMYANQLKLWAEIIRESLTHDGSIEAMEAKILDADPMVKQVADHIRKHPIMSRGMLKQNIQGFVEYFKKFSV